MLDLDRSASFPSRVLALAGQARFVAPSLARLVVGWVFLEAGWGKLHNLERVVEFFRGLGIPSPHIQAPLAAGTELICGALLLLGLATRLAALPLMVVMAVALCTALADDIATLSDLFARAEFLYIVLLLGMATSGPGPLSLDALRVRAQQRRRGGQGTGGAADAAVAGAPVAERALA